MSNSGKNYSLTLCAPGKEPVTFDMQSHKLILRLDPSSHQSVLVLNANGHVIMSLYRHHNEAAFANALVSVGRYLCDQGAH